MISYILCKTLVPWLCSRSQPGIRVIIRDLRGHLLHTVTFLVNNFIAIQVVNKLLPVVVVDFAQVALMFELLPNDLLVRLTAKS